MRKFTTPLLSFFIKDYELIETDNIYVTFADKERGVFLTVDNFKDDQVDISHQKGGTIVDVSLTQEQTGMFPPVSPLSPFDDMIVAVQVNWVMSDGRRFATNICNVDCGENLIPNVLDYDGGGQS